MRTLSIIAGLFIASMLPYVGYAVTADELRAQIERLMVQMAQLQQSLGTSIPSSTTAPTASGSAACPALVRTLARGSRGDDVLSLQQFLMRLGFITPNEVSGYYGALTERGVQSFQTQYNVVNVGDPASTGYGVVGMRTREAIAQQCAALKPIGKRCQVYRPLLCVAGTYAAEGPADASGCPTEPRCVPGSKPSVTPGITSCRAYPVPSCGAGMRAQSGPLDSAGCPTETICVPDAPTTVPISSGPLQAYPRAGNIPLTVTFTGNVGGSSSLETAVWIDYGDGHIENAVGMGAFTRTHTYLSAGTYTAKLLWREFAPGHIPLMVRTAGTATVVVGGPSSARPTVRVMSPNGGEIIHAWRQTPVQWEAADVPAPYVGGDGSKITYKILVKLVAKGGKIVGSIPVNGSAIDYTLRTLSWDPATLNGGFNALDEVKLQVSIVKETDRCAVAGQSTAAASACRTEEVMAIDESDTWFGLKGVTVCNNAVYPISCISS